MKPGSKVIGMAIGQKSILLAEVGPKAGRNAVQHFAEFSFPEGLSLSTPEQLGMALGQFIKTRKFSTRDVVIGLPAKRLLTRRKDIPAASLEVAASTLRLQAEGDFSSELDNLVMDFAGTPSSSEPQTVLVIATNREILEQCEAMATAAGLRVQGITSTTAALGRATSRLPGGDGLVLNLGQSGAELVVQHGLDPAHLRHLNSTSNTSPESITALAGEIRRVMASIPTNGTPQTLAMWRGASLSSNPNAGMQLEQRLSMPVTTPQLSSIVTSENAEADVYAPAVAVALSAVDPDGLPVDFLHSRMELPPEPLISNAKKLMIVGALLFGALIGFGEFQKYSLQKDLDQITNDAASENIKWGAATQREKIRDYVRDWKPTAAFYTNVMEALDAHFPPEAESIWITRMSIQGRVRNNWAIDGKAANENRIAELYASMQKDDAHFSEVKVASVARDTVGQLFNYRIEFTYRDPNN